MTIKSLFNCLGLQLLFLSCSQLLALELPATHLRIELLKGESVKQVNDSMPEFSWVVPHLGNRTIQEAFRVQLVEAGKPFSELEPALWDSGKTDSSQSLAVSYQGSQLVANSDYRWRVKLWLFDEDNRVLETHWSQPQYFSTSSYSDDQASGHDLTQSIVPPQKTTKLENGNFLIDFGKVAFGYLELSLSAEESGEIVVHLGERGSDDGVQRVLAPRSSVRYYPVVTEVQKSQGVYRVNPPRDRNNTNPDKAVQIPGRFGRISPFRFVELESPDFEIDNVSAQQIAVHYPFNDSASSFRSSDDTLNAIWDLSKYTMQATSFAGLYVDGDRERIPYEADAYINQLSHYAVDNEYTLARRTHEYLLSHPTWPTEWKQHSVMLAWSDWMHTGDVESLSAHFSVLKEEKTLEYLARPDGLLESYPDQTTRSPTPRDIVDWPVGEREGFDFKAVNAVVNAFYFLNLNQMAEMADALEFAAEAERYRAMALQVQQSYQAVFFDAGAGLYRDGEHSDHYSFHANVAPLAFGLVPAAYEQEVADFVKSQGMAGSVYFAQYLLEALYNVGEADYAMDLLTSKERRSWFNMIRQGATITMEAWDDIYKPNQDWNHAWGAVPANITSRYVVGVKPLEPGFSRFEIYPRLASLDFIEGRVPTIKGDIEVVVSKENTDYRLSVRIPGNSEAEIYFPTDLGSSIQVSRNGQIQEIETMNDRVFLGVFGSGQYEFSVKTLEQ